MKNTVLNKMISGTLLAAALMISFTPCANAKGFNHFNNKTDKLALNNDKEDVIMLKGDVSLTSKDEKVSLSLKDSDVEQVLRMFADIAGLNILFYDSITDKITLDLVDEPINSAFDFVMEMKKLSYSILNGNTLVISRAGTDIGLNKQGITFLPVKYVDATSILSTLTVVL